MSGTNASRVGRSRRRLIPVLENLDRRELLSAGGFRHSIGPYLTASPLGPRISRPPGLVDPHTAVTQYLATTLGSGIDQVQAFSQLQNGRSRGALVQRVLSQPLLHRVLGDPDTYQIFASPALSGLLGSQQISGPTSLITQTAVTPVTPTVVTPTTPAVTTVVPTVVPATNNVLIPGLTAPPVSTVPGLSSTTNTIPASTVPTTGTVPGAISPTTITAVPVTATAVPTTPATATVQLIAFTIPDQAVIQTPGDLTTTVQVNPSGGAPGFFAEVPTSNIRIIDPGPPLTGTVLIPSDQIPAGYPVPDQTFLPIGTFSPAYATTAPLLVDMLKSGATRSATDAPNTVPGLRLVNALYRNRPFPPLGRTSYLRMLRLAVERNLFTLNTTQATQVSNALNEFTQQVSTMAANGSLTPAIPPDAPNLPVGPLAGTLEISTGVLRRLTTVAPQLSGLQIPGVGNVPGRLDVGYVFDQAGNYGIIFSLRGPLSNTNAGLSSADVAAGDVRVTVSNAPSIAALTGTSVEEGVTIGSGVAADLGSSQLANGVTTFSASAGYGAGIEYGTAIGVSVVVPLGNVYSLIPSAPNP